MPLWTIRGNINHASRKQQQNFLCYVWSAKPMKPRDWISIPQTMSSAHEERGSPLPPNRQHMSQNVTDKPQSVFLVGCRQAYAAFLNSRLGCGSQPTLVLRAHIQAKPHDTSRSTQLKRDNRCHVPLMVDHLPKYLQSSLKHQALRHHQALP